MRAPVSVVMAVTNAETVLPLQLAALGEALAEGLIRELILVDGGSTDGTRRIADAAGALIFDGPAERRAALRLGRGEAQGEWLLVPSPGTAPAPGWTARLLGHLARVPVQSGRLPARRVSVRPWLRLWPGQPWLLLPQGPSPSLAGARAPQRRGRAD